MSIDVHDISGITGFYMGAAVQVIAWVNQYSDMLRDLGIEEDALAFPAGSDRGVSLLTDKYIERMRLQLNAWFTNILEVQCSPIQTCTFLHCRPAMPYFSFTFTLPCTAGSHCLTAHHLQTHKSLRQACCHCCLTWSESTSTLAWLDHAAREPSRGHVAVRECLTQYSK